VVTATVGIVERYFVVLEIIEFTKIYSYYAMVLCCFAVYYGYSNSRYSAMVLLFVWSLFS